MALSPVIRRFSFSSTSVYTIEMGDLYFRFFTNRQPITSGTGVFQIDTPYLIADVREVKWTQVNDLVYLTHPQYSVYRLTRLADDNWTLEAVEFDEPPFLDENVTPTTITPSATSGTSVTLAASDDIFLPSHEGAYWRVGHKVPAAYVEHPITANGDSTSLMIYGVYALRTYGNWGADILIQRSLDEGATWETVANYHGVIPGPGEAGFRNFDASGEADEVALYRVRVENFDPDSESSAVALLERPEAIVYGYGKITSVGSGQSAIVDVIDDFYAATASDLWAEGAWSALRGFPRVATMHEQRLVLASTSHQPMTVWGSVLDDFENFRRGTNDDDSYAHTLAAVGQASVEWMASREALMLGTSLGNWRMRGDGYGAIITPTRVDAKKRDNEGSAYVTAEEAGAPVVFVGLKGLKLWASVYNQDADRILNEELTNLADQITVGGILEMAWQADKRILWCVRGDGVLIALTYDETQQVAGWHEHTTDGLFRSVTTIAGDDDAEDEVWVIVERTIGSETLFYVELLDPDLWTAREDYFGVDSGLSYDGSPISHVTGLDHLAGQEIVGLADGVPFEATVDSNGEFDLPSGMAPASIIHAGLAYVATMETFRLDADVALGVHIGRTKKVDGVVARVAKTWGGEYAVAGESFPVRPPETKEDVDLLGDARPEDINLSGFQQGHTYDPVVTLTAPDPLPMNVIALTIDLSVGES